MSHACQKFIMRKKEDKNGYFYLTMVSCCGGCGVVEVDGTQEAAAAIAGSSGEGVSADTSVATQKCICIIKCIRQCGRGLLYNYVVLNYMVRL